MYKESIYINPLTDYGFKLLFGEERNKEYLISFLNALFGDEHEIADVTYVNKEATHDSPEDRTLIYDIHCTTTSGEKIIVEMQNRYQTYYRDRAVYYMSSEVVRQARKGKWNYKLTPVYGIFMMNFDWKEHEIDRLREDICYMDTYNHKIFNDKIRMIFLKLPLMRKDEDSCENDFERWIYILKNLEKMKKMPAQFTAANPIFGRLNETARVAALSVDERTEYERSLKAYRDNYAIMETERSEGRAEGRAEGLAEGLARGRAEIVKNMFKMGLSLDVIAEAVKLTTDKIKQILGIQ